MVLGQSAQAAQYSPREPARRGALTNPDEVIMIGKLDPAAVVAGCASRRDLRLRLMRFLADTGRVTQGALDANSPLITSGLIDSATLFELALWIEEEVGRPVDLTRIDLPGDWDTVDLVIAFIERERNGQRARGA